MAIKRLPVAQVSSKYGDNVYIRYNGACGGTSLSVKESELEEFVEILMQAFITHKVNGLKNAEKSL